MTLRTSQVRRGLTLLEVVVAMAIFLLAIGVLWQLFAIAGDHALDVKLQARTSMACQSKLNEIIIGAEPASSTGGYTSFADDANKDLQWKAEVNPSEYANLYNVKVSVKFELEGRVFESHLAQHVLDPAVRGSTLDQPIMAQPGTPTQDPMTDPSSTTPTTPTNPTTPNTGSNKGGGTQPGGKGGGTQPGGKGGGNLPGGKGITLPGGKGGGNLPGGKGGGNAPAGGKGGGGPAGGGPAIGGNTGGGPGLGGNGPLGGGNAPTGGKGAGGKGGGGKGG